MKYFKKLIILIIGMIVCSVIVQTERLGISPNNKMNMDTIVKKEVPVNAITEKYTSDNKILIIYDDKNSKNVLTKDNMSKNLSYMKIDHEEVCGSDFNTDKMNDYSSIILVMSNIKETLDDKMYEISEYVEEGGRLIIGTIPADMSNNYEDIWEKAGVKAVYDYKEVNGLNFVDELIPGSKGRIFKDDSAFNDTCMDVDLDDDCKVHIKSSGNDKEIPILWERDCGRGKIIFYNGTSLGGDYYCGIFAGTTALLEDDFMYPIINAKVIFIDDFPSKQYDGINDLITQNYNRTIKEFYRDIWWPDMNGIAKKYNLLYTGLFVMNYSDIVEPDEFVFENDPMEKYYGNSLLKNNYEIGLHGYNHQPLVGKGYLTEEDGEDYKPWKSEEDMRKSIEALLAYSEKMFPNAQFRSYVPPSNYLSSEGRKALKEAVPDLRVISGVFNDPNGKAYVQNFEKAEDGIVEFPRFTSGMWYDDSTRFEYMNGLGLYGVFSHFIHPDDILDKDRGRGQDWKTLFEDFGKILSDIDNNYAAIRPLRATEAADAVEIYEMLDVNLKYHEDYIEGQCDNFYGEAFFYLKTDKKPIASDDKCEISKVGGNSDKYYFVKIKSPQFKIQLR